MENQIREFTKKGNRRRLFKRVVSLLCVVVLLFTMNTLKRNANTLERIAMCGLQEHTHTAGCYNSSGELVCAIPEHVHTDACYQQSPSDELVLNGDDLEIADGLVDAGDTQSLDLSLDLDQGELLDFVQDSDAPASNVQDIGNDMPVLDGDLVFDTSYNNEETQQLAANTSVEEAQGAVDETQSEEAQQLLEEEQIAIEDGQDQSTGEGQEQITFEEDQEQPVEQPTEAAQGQPVEEETEQPVEEAQEQPVEEETEQPVEEETEQPVEEETEQPVEEETEQPAEEAQEQPVEEETEQPVEGEQLVEEDQDQIAIEEQLVDAEQEQPVEEVQEQLVIEEQEEPVVEAQEEPVVEEQEEPVVEEQEEPVVEEQEEPVVEEQEEPAVEEQEEPVVEEQEEPVAEEQEEPVVEEQEEPVVEEQEEPVVEEQEEPVVEEQEESAVEEQEEPAVEEQEEPAVEEQEQPAIEEQEEPAEEAEQPTEEAEQPAEEEAEQPAEEEAEQPAEEEAEQPTEEEAEQPTEENAEQPAEEEAEQPTEEEAEQPAEEEAEQPAEEEAEQPTEEEAEQPAEEETEEPAIEEAEQPAEVESEPEAEGESEEEPEARIAYPAKQFRQGTAYINVSVDAPEGAFPEGTVMVVKDVEDQGTIDNIQQSVAEDFVEVTSVHAVDISFWYNDAEIEPLLPIAVVMSAVEAPNEAHETVVVHVDDNGETQLVDSEATGAAEAALEMPAAADAEAQAFEADTFSVYALVTKQVIETKYIDDHGDTWRIKVDYGKDAKLPEGASLRVAEVTDETYLAQAEAALESGKRITKARFFDIKIMDGDREVQPDGQVQVTVTLEGDEGEVEATENQNDIGNPDVVAMHFVEQDDETVSVEKQSAVETDEGVVFNADGFSAWGVIYTVDFEVEGNQGEITLDFTAFDALKLPGEGELCYNTEDCSIHVALARLSSIINSKAEAGYDIDVNANLVNNYEFDFAKAEMGKADSGIRFADGELVIEADGFVELTEGERMLRVRATGLTALKQALLEAENVSIEVVSGNVPLGSEASYTAHTDEETAELVENYINNEENGDSEVAGYSAADLKIVRNDETLPVEGKFKVTVDKASLVPQGMKLDKLYHIHRNENDEAVVEELEAVPTEDGLGLVFEVKNFSDIVASYTVDFEYTDPETGKTYAWSWPGEDSYSVASIMSELGVAGEIGDVSLECVEGEEVAGALYLEQKDGEWYLTSDVAFDETYELTVVVDGKAYIVIVTDDQQGSALSSISITFKQDGGEATDTGGTLDGTYYVVLKNTIYYPGNYTYGWWSQVSLTDGAYSVPIDNATIKSFVEDKNVLSGTDSAPYSDASNLNYVSADSIKLVKYSGSDADSEISDYVLNNQTNNITEINNNSKIGGYTVSRAESIDSEGNYAFTAVKDPVFTVQGISFPTGETVNLADSYYLAIGYTENNNTVYNYYARISADGTIGAIKDASGMTVTEIPQAAGFCLVKPVGSFSITSLNDIKSYINDASKIEKIEDAGEFDKYLISFPSDMTPDSRVYSITATKQRSYTISLTFRDIDFDKLDDVTLTSSYYMLVKDGNTYKYYAPVTGAGIGAPIKDASDQEVTDGMYGVDGIEFVKYTGGNPTMSDLTGVSPKLTNGSLIDDLYLLEIPDYAVNYSYTLNAIRQPNRTASMQFIDAAGANISTNVALDGNYYIVAYDGTTAMYYAPVTGTSGALTFYNGENTPVEVQSMPYMSSFDLRKTDNAAVKLDDARGGADQKMMLTGSDGTTKYVVTYDITNDTYAFKAAQASSYQAVIQFKNKSGAVVQPSDVSGSYGIYGSISKDGLVYGFVTDSSDFSSASSYDATDHTVKKTIQQFYKDNYTDHGFIYRTAADDVVVAVVKNGARLNEGNGALQDPNKALEIGDAIGAYALKSVTADKANARTTLTFQEVDPYNYTITTSDGSAIAFDSTANSGWYILSVLKKADGTRTYHYVAPVTLQGETSVSGTISTYYSNSDPSKITLASPASDTDTRSSVYVAGDTVSTVLVHMNTTPTSYKDILQLEENGIIKGEMFADGDGANCYTLGVTNSGGTSTLTLTKAVNPTVTVNFLDATGVAKASILTDDHYYLYVELDRGRGKANYGYVTDKLDLTQTTQSFTIPYFEAASNKAIPQRDYLTDGNSYTVYVVKRTDSAPTVQWCQAGTGVIMYDKGDQIEKTVFDASSTVNKTAPYETAATELNAVVNIKELPVLSIQTQFKANNALETAPITFTDHRYDLLVSMTDAKGNTYYRLVPVDTTLNPSAATTITDFVTNNDDGVLYYYTGAETIKVAVVQTPGSTAPGLHNAIYGEGGCFVFEEGAVTGDGYTVSSALSGNVITTTLEKKAATAMAFTANVTFYDKKGDGATQLSNLNDHLLSGNYYLLATLNTGDEETGYTPVGYAVVDVTQADLDAANGSGAFSVSIPANTAYTILDANGNEVTGSTLSYDPALYTMSTRLYNTTEENIPTTYATAKAGNDTVDGYDFWSNDLATDGKSTQIKLYKAYKKKYQIQLDFSEPITIDAGDPLHVKVEAQHSTTGTDVFETDVTGAELSTWLHLIEDQTKTPVEQHWSSYGTQGNTFSGNEKVTVTLSRNGQVIAQGERVYDYTVNYKPDPKRTEVNDDDTRVTTITDYVELTKIPSSYDYNFYTILGDGVGYGITADYLYQNGHIQSNFATNYYYGNNIIEPDLAGHGAVIVIADYALKEGKALEIGGSHVAGTDTVIYLGNGGTLDLVKNVADRPWVHVVPSSTEDLTNNVVNPIINHMQQISAELLTHETTIHPTPNNEGRMYIDLLDFPDDATIYLDGDELSFWLGKGNDGLFIKKHKNQTIVFNYDSSDSAVIGQYHVAYAEGEDSTYVGNNYFSTHSPTGKGAADNVFADDLAKHVVYNLNSVKHITADTIVGMVLVPRADSTMDITGTSAGWVISAGYVTNSGAEWHSVYADMPDSSTTDLTIFKMIDATENKPTGTTPGKYQVFTFDLDHLITTGSSRSWNRLGSEDNSSRTVKFSSISEMEAGWNVYRITEHGPAAQTVGSYINDSRSVYAFVRYFAVGGRVMVAGMPRYYMQMDENDAAAVEEFTFDEATFDPSRETLRQAVGANNTTGVHLKAMNIPTFNNITKRDGLEVKKVVTGTNNPNARFIFQIDLWQTPVGEDAVRIFPDIEGTPTNSRTYPMTGVAGETEITFSKVDTDVPNQEYARATLTLKANQTAHISGIPVGANYTVTELSTVADVTDENKDDPVVFDATTGVSNGYTLTTRTDDAGVIIENDARTATFTNVYQAVGEYTIDASKTMLGRDMQEGEFFFIVEQGGETKLSGQTSGTGPNAAISWGEPGKLTFTQNDVGTHTYIIREDMTRLPSGVAAVGDGEFEIQLQVVDNFNGTLTVTRVDENAGTIAFQNTLKAEATLTGTKTLIGRDMEEGETFTFNVTEHVDDEDVVVATGTAVGPSDENNPVDITFTPITYLYDPAVSYPVTHTYTVAEDETGLGRGVTNTTGYTFTATVQEVYDATEGTFTASEPVYSPSGVAFENTWVGEKKPIVVTKEWYLRPLSGDDPVEQATGVEKTFQLYRTTSAIPAPASGSAYTPAEITALAASGTVESYGSPFTLGGESPYTYSNDQLPKYDLEDNEYYYFVVEVGADDTEYVYAEETVGEAPNTTTKEVWTVKNYKDETTVLNVEKKWQSASGDDVTSSQSTVDQIQYELYQTETVVNTPKPVASTVSVIDGGVTYCQTGWSQQPKSVSVGGKLTGIVKGSTIKIKVDYPSNSNHGDFVGLKVNEQPIAFDSTESYWVHGQAAYGVAIIENLQNDITISGTLTKTDNSQAMTITVTVTYEPTEVSGGTGGDPTTTTNTHKVGTVTLTKTTASIALESAFQDVGITVAHGTGAWTSVIENLPAHDEQTTSAATVSTNYTYYVQEIIPSGASYQLLSVSPATSVAPDGSTITITNKFNEQPKGSVKVTKAFVGLPSGTLPSGFQITNSANSAVFGLDSADGKLTPTGGSGTEADPYYWQIDNLPLPTTVTFIETGYDVDGYSVTVTGSANAATATAAAATTPGEASFVNTYTAHTTYVPKVTKTLSGRAWGNADSFTFTLAANAGNPAGATMPTGAGLTATVTNNSADHTASFGAITFTAAGTYAFTVKETVPADASNGTVTWSQASDEQKAVGGFVKDGVTYDGSAKALTVEVQAQNNALVVTRVRVNETDVTGDFAIAAASANVTNTYAATGSVDFKAKKVFTNGALSANKSFTFKLTQVTANNSQMPATASDVGTGEGKIPALKLGATESKSTTATSGNTDTVTFDAITFTKNATVDETGDYWFLLEEDVPDGVDANGVKDGIKYDTNKKWIKVTVVDAGDGTLTVTKDPAVEDGVDGTWTNEQLGELQITKKITVNQADSSRTGTFWYAVYKATDVANNVPKKNDEGKIIVPPAKDADGKSLVGSITVNKNGTETVTVPNLYYGEYYVFELTGDPANGDIDVKLIASGDKGVDAAIDTAVYHVTGSGTTKATVGATPGTATLNNDVRETSITGEKTWKPFTSDLGERKNPVNTKLTLTLTRYTVGEDENGNKVYSGKTTVGTVEISTDANGTITKKVGDQTTTEILPATNDENYINFYNAAWSYTWENLPLYGISNGTTVKYAYKVEETVDNDWYSRSSSENSGYLPDANGNTTQQFTNIEKSPVALPSTGGVGTGVIYGAGAALVLLAVLGMILTKRKRTDGEGIR